MQAKVIPPLSPLERNLFIIAPMAFFAFMAVGYALLPVSPASCASSRGGR